jgi:hypothetical protein
MSTWINYFRPTDFINIYHMDATWRNQPDTMWLIYVDMSFNQSGQVDIRLLNSSQNYESCDDLNVFESTSHIGHIGHRLISHHLHQPAGPAAPSSSSISGVSSMGLSATSGVALASSNTRTAPCDARQVMRFQKGPAKPQKTLNNWVNATQSWVFICVYPPKKGENHGKSPSSGRSPTFTSIVPGRRITQWWSVWVQAWLVSPSGLSQFIDGSYYKYLSQWI